MAQGKKTGGRQAGTPNKSTAEVRAFARNYGPEAIELLANMMTTSENEAVKISAAKEILDRAYGKSYSGAELRETEKEIEREEAAAAYAKTPEGIAAAKRRKEFDDSLNIW